MHIEHERNAVWWNETASWYGKSADDDMDVLRSGGSFLQQSERAILGDLSWCGRAIHLQCSHGNDALSLLNDGASEVVGVDISENLLAAAQKKSSTLNAPATWVLSDILDTPHYLDGTADLVYTGKGAIAWMMDLEAWARVVARLLKPGGLFFIYESHPLDWVWADNAETYVLDETHGDYFSVKPRTRLFAARTETQPHYRQWTFAQTINSIIHAGLVIESVAEYPEHFWGIHPHIHKKLSARLPHTFAIRARKGE